MIVVRKFLWQNFMFNLDSNKRKWKLYENEKLYILYNLACTLWHESCLSLETMGCSLKRGNSFENSTKLILPKCFFLIMSTFALLFRIGCHVNRLLGWQRPNDCSLAVHPPSQTVSGWFDTKSFRYNPFHFNSKSIWYPSKVDSMQICSVLLCFLTCNISAEKLL